LYKLLKYFRTVKWITLFREVKMKKMKLILILAIFLVGSFASAERLLGKWDMDGTCVTKTVDGVMTGSPGGSFVSEERTAIETPYGDVVFGPFGAGWSTETNIPTQTETGGGASGVDGDESLLFVASDNQSAFIPEVMREIVSEFRVKFDFQINAEDVGSLLTGAHNRFEIRTTFDGSGNVGLKFICWTSGGIGVVETGNVASVNQWNNAECWVEDDMMYAKINDHVESVIMPGLLSFPDDETRYEGITIGAGYDGDRRWTSAYIDNIELYSLDVCGSWGYLPTDFNEDCVVDIEDLAVLVESWLVCTDPQVEGCVDLY
jgi:hypothetical protein